MAITWPLNTWKTAILVALVMLGMGLNPYHMASSMMYLAYRLPGLVFASMRTPPPAASSLKAAILNVTGDFNELSFLIQDFLRSPGVDPAVEASFRQYLAHRAGRSHPSLESALDWILAAYKFAFPFLVISLVAKLGSSASGGGGARDDQGEHELEAMQQNNGMAGPPPPGRQTSWAMEQLAPPSRVSVSEKGSSVATGYGRQGSKSPLGPGTPQERVARQKHPAAAAFERRPAGAGALTHAQG